ncbi:MAG TPA: hypothetical protein GXZ60_05690 [Intrasporangiaceae bacterium]|nr:hypothetical protein [Intrasporangiaceae bacterium]
MVVVHQRYGLNFGFVAFWAALLARTSDPSGPRLPGVVETDFELRFVLTDKPKTGLHRMHFDLTSTTADDQQRRVDLAIGLGASHLVVGQLGDEAHVVLADPEGNEFLLTARLDR